MTSLPENIPFTISTSDPTGSIHACNRIVIGQLGQSLDGCIATPTGDSKYINSDCGLTHLHKIRSAVEAVVVGVGCVNADDPKLSVRLCSGDNPVRVIIDPKGRVNLHSNFIDAGVLDRLHLIVAPVIMGGGLSGLNLAPIDKLHEALRPEVTLYPLGRDVLFDCDFSKA